MPNRGRSFCVGWIVRRAEVAEMLASADHIAWGSGADDRIVDGTGAVVAIVALQAEAAARLADRRLAYVHVRLARNNCHQLPLDR